MRRMAYNGGIRAIGDNEPHADNLQCVRKHLPKTMPHFGPVQNAVLHICGVAFGAPAFNNRAEYAEKVHTQNDRKHHHQNNKGEQTQQQDAVAVVPPNLGLDTDVFHYRSLA